MCYQKRKKSISKLNVHKILIRMKMPEISLDKNLFGLLRIHVVFRTSRKNNTKNCTSDF